MRPSKHAQYSQNFASSYRDILWHSVLAVTILVVTSAVQFIVNILLARLLTQETFGDVSVALRVVEFTSVLALFGTNRAAIKFIPDYITTQQWSKVRGYVRYVMMVVGLASLLIIAFAIGITIFLLAIHFVTIQEVEYRHPVVMIAILTPLWAVSLFLRDFLQSIGRVTNSIWPQYILLPLLAIVAILFYEWIRGDISTQMVMIMYCLAAIAAIIIQTTLILHYLPMEFFANKPRYQHKYWQPVGMQLMVSVLGFAALTSIELIMLEIFGQHDYEVGRFAAIISLSAFVWLIYSAVNTVVAPKISPAVTGGNTKKLQRILKSSIVIIALPVLVLSGVMIVYGKELLTLFGPGYGHSTDALIIVIVGTAIAAILGVFLGVLQFSGYHKTASLVVIIGLLFTIVSSMVLVPIWGINGAAIAFAATRVLIGAANTFFACRYLKICSFNSW